MRGRFLGSRRRYNTNHSLSPLSTHRLREGAVIPRIQVYSGSGACARHPWAGPAASAPYPLTLPSHLTLSPYPLTGIVNEITYLALDSDGPLVGFFDEFACSRIHPMLAKLINEVVCDSMAESLWFM